MKKYTLRDVILRCPSSSLSPTEKEALQHARVYDPRESSNLPFLEMAVIDGSDDPEEATGPDTAPPETASKTPMVPSSGPVFREVI